MVKQQVESQVRALPRACSLLATHAHPLRPILTCLHAHLLVPADQGSRRAVCATQIHQPYQPHLPTYQKREIRDPDPE